MTQTASGRAHAPQPPHNDAEFRAELLNLIPFLRAFARTLCGDRDEADDLCQEALVKAWQSASSFERGTNLKAWLFMILRNHFYSVRRAVGASVHGTKASRRTRRRPKARRPRT